MLEIENVPNIVRVNKNVKRSWVYIYRCWVWRLSSLTSSHNSMWLTHHLLVWIDLFTFLVMWGRLANIVCDSSLILLIGHK